MRNPRPVKMLTCFGLTFSVRRWSHITGVPVGEINARLRNGWAIKVALYTDPTNTPHPIVFKNVDAIEPQKPKTTRVYKPVQKLTYEGQTHSLKYWAKLTGIPEETIKLRLADHWSIEDTLGFNYAADRGEQFFTAERISAQKYSKRLKNGEMLVRAKQTLHPDVIAELNKYVGVKAPFKRRGKRKRG